MHLISLDKISKSFGDRVLFQNISFSLQKGEKIAIVGRNGAGKSTLLKILMGQEKPDTGILSFQKDLRIAFLAQEFKVNPQHKILEALGELAGEDLKNTLRYEFLLSSSDPALEKEQDRLCEWMESTQNWELLNEYKIILQALGLEDTEQKVASLSGGQLRRLGLAALLLQKSDVLVLDEPTNHLDIPMIEWLENYLTKKNCTVLLVTHDRYFLDQVCTGILELEDQNLYLHKGDYTYFLEQKALRDASAAQTFQKNQNTLRKESEWASRMPKARGTKSKSRLDAYESLKEKTKKKVEQKLELQIQMNRLGSKAIELEHVHKSFVGKKILEDFTYRFYPGQKIGLVGANGVGKTTFLRMLLNLETPDQGKIDRGETLVFGYYSQKGLAYKEDQRVIDFVKAIAEEIPLAGGKTMSAGQFLQQFGFSPSLQYTFLSKLSGGEKKRLHLITVLLQNPNFLIMDEPTNDLDIWTIHVLEDFLQNYGGCLLVVSHDRAFMDQLVDELLVFEGEGKVRSFDGNYATYFLEQNTTQPIPSKDIPKVQSPISKSSKKINTFLIEKLEQELEQLEKIKKQLLLDLENSSDTQQLTTLGEQLGKIHLQIEEKTLAWMEQLEGK